MMSQEADGQQVTDRDPHERRRLRSSGPVLGQAAKAVLGVLVIAAIGAEYQGRGVEVRTTRQNDPLSSKLQGVIG